MYISILNTHRLCVSGAQAKKLVTVRLTKKMPPFSSKFKIVSLTYIRRMAQRTSHSKKIQRILYRLTILQKGLCIIHFFTTALAPVLLLLQ